MLNYEGVDGCGFGVRTLNMYNMFAMLGILCSFAVLVSKCLAQLGSRRRIVFNVRKSKTV